MADDFEWLENHCRQQPDLAAHAGQLRLAAGLTRNVLGAAVEGTPPTPLHIAVVGGAGTGKSTVTNLIMGSVVADANPQAGYTRHPTAFVPSNTEWPSFQGFLRPLTRAAADVPANRDEDLYQFKIRSTIDPDPLNEFVVWDCPDMTTWSSTGYVSRLMEVAALADVIVYVASDERYNDEVPTQFLQLLVRAGKAVVVVLTKMNPANAAALIEHFRTAVLGTLTQTGDIPPVPVVTVPHMPLAERNDPTGAAGKYRAELLNQILVLCPTADAARKRTRENAIRFLTEAADGLLEVAHKDLAEIEAWKSTVTTGQRTFEDRYQREYLATEPFRRFDRTRTQLLELLEPTGRLKPVGRVFAYLRWPVSYLCELLASMRASAETPSVAEATVLKTGSRGWLDGLQAECLRRSGRHPMWATIARGFDEKLTPLATAKFTDLTAALESKEGAVLESAGRSLPEQLEAKPGLLNAARVGTLLLDCVAVGLVLVYTWVPSWYHLLLIPLVVAVRRGLDQFLIWSVVESARSAARKKRLELLSAELSVPFADWLKDWPAVGGTAAERLQLILRRVPETLRRLTEHLSPPPTPSASPSP